MSFIDKEGREIDVEFDGLDSIAKHNGSEIGKIEFDIQEQEHGPDRYYLYGMNVDPSYQRAGIATELMRVAVKTIGDNFSWPDFNAVGGTHVDSSEYLTGEGEAFFYHLIEIGVIKDKPSYVDPDDQWDAL